MNELSMYKSKIFFIRGVYVMIDRDLSDFYGTQVKIFNKAQKRKQSSFTEGSVFQLTKEEWAEVLAAQGLPPQKGHLPWAYTQKSAYKMAFILDTEVGLKVADLILEVFIEAKEGSLVPVGPNNKLIQLENKMKSVSREMEGSKVVNNFHAPVTIIHGGMNQINNVHNSEDLIQNILQVMTDKEVSHNDELRNLLNKTIELINKRDKKGALETITKAADLGTKLQKLAPWFIAAAGMIKSLL